MTRTRVTAHFTRIRRELLCKGHFVRRVKTGVYQIDAIGEPDAKEDHPQTQNLTPAPKQVPPTLVETQDILQEAVRGGLPPYVFGHGHRWTKNSPDSSPWSASDLGQHGQFADDDFWP